MRIIAVLALLVTTLVIPSAAVLLPAHSVAHAQAAADGEAKRAISDAELLDYATGPYDRAKMMGKRIVLGLNHDTRVIAIFPCSDVCPHYTTRVIHYDVPLARCAEVAGVEKMVPVPYAIAMIMQPFCIPKVLADSWEKLQR
jgi:hypothetical protein